MSSPELAAVGITVFWIAGCLESDTLYFVGLPRLEIHVVGIVLFQ